ncbi:MAG: hypothetical protein C5S49_06700 [Candidatus Methanogaster sp.]|nr:MAG: hypothetical protein C5S49_06700 [ANME-2 cluster archaeon]
MVMPDVVWSCRLSRTVIYYWKNRGEADFAIKNSMKVEELIQVCYSIDEETAKREVSACGCTG